jgi:hypothetical protein
MTGFHSLEDAEMVGEHLGKLFLGFKNSSTSKKIKVVVPLFIFVVWFTLRLVGTKLTTIEE